MNLISNDVGIGFFNSFVNYPDSVVRLKLEDDNMPKFVTNLVYLKSHYFNELQQKVLDNIRHSIK
ncbi:type 2 periplasmic-binding domain-containing protein [Apilactobacillus micheneri]|nr:hypothetical protein [Apilactobacillus micheneri]